MPKVTRILIFVMVLYCLFVFCSDASQVQMSLDNTEINSGEDVLIKLDSQRSIERINGVVETPLGNKYKLEFARRHDGTYVSRFRHTTDKGFQTTDWNVYRIVTTLRYADGGVEETTNYFNIKEAEKDLYFVFWVDDFGAHGELKKEFRKWYHDNFGPISYALSEDDRHYYDLSLLLSKYDFKRDYLSHHFHVFHWDRGYIFLFMENSIYKRYLKFRYYVNSRIGFKLVRVGNILLLTLLLAIFAVKFRKSNSRKSSAIIIICISIAIFSILLRQNHIYVDNYNNWRFEHHNIEWSKNFLKDINDELNSHGYRFPAVTRHGWNLPPKGVMRFYMSELGVLADASGVSGIGKNDYLTRYGYYRRVIDWKKVPVPYYASLNGGYGELWIGNEEDRGLLEMPLTFNNFQDIEVDSNVIEKIKQLPSGALVSTYLHPYDNPDNFKTLVNFIRNRYRNVKFIRADTYVDVFMKHRPRPIIIDFDLNTFWAFVENGRLNPIRRTQAIKMSVENISGKAVTYRLEIFTFKEVPILQINILNPKFVIYDNKRLEIEADKKWVILERVKPGRHMLKLVEN